MIIVIINNAVGCCAAVELEIHHGPLDRWFLLRARKFLHVFALPLGRFRQNVEQAKHIPVIIVVNDMYQLH